MSNRYVFLVVFLCSVVFPWYIVASDSDLSTFASLLDGSSSSSSSSDNSASDQLLGAVLGDQPSTSNILAPTTTTPVVTNPAQPSSSTTSATSIVPVVSTGSSNQSGTANDITDQINQALTANQATIAQGVEQRVQGSTGLSDAQKDQEEQLLIGEFAEDPDLVAYLENYVKMFGDEQYAQVGLAFSANLQAIQKASFSQLVSQDFLKQTIDESEKALANLYTTYTKYGLHPNITLDNVFTRSFFDVVQLYGIYLKALTQYVYQMVVSRKIAATDIINLQKCITLIMGSFDTLKGLYFSNQQQLVQDSGSQTNTAETIFAQDLLLLAAISAKQLMVDSSLNYYKDSALALAWAECINLFASLPNANYPHTASMNFSVNGYQTFDEYLQEVCGNLAKILDGGVRFGSHQMTGSAANNSSVLAALRNYYNAAIQMYAWQNTDAAQIASASLQNFFTTVDKVYKDAFKKETDTTAVVNASRQLLQTPGKSLVEIKAAALEFAKAQATYQQLIATFNSINDETDAAYCNQILQQLAGDNYIGLACVYWQSFLQDEKAGGALLSTLPVAVTTSSLGSVMSSLQIMCTNAQAVLGGTKNPYACSSNDTTTSIAQMYTNAMQAYNSASTQVSTAGTVSASSTGPVDSIMNLALLNQLQNSSLQIMQNYFQNFAQALQALQTVSSENVSVFQTAVANALSAASLLQDVAVKYPEYTHFLPPVGQDWNKALISTLVAIFQVQSFGSQSLLQYLYGSVLQSSSAYMLSAQQTAMNTMLTQLGAQVDIAQQVQQSFQSAQAATNTAAALPLWNTALNLAQTYFTLGKSQLSLQDSAARLVNYITTVQAYINFALLKTSDFSTALMLYRLAAQAYYATQSCITAKVTLPATITADALGQLVIHAAHNSTNTGVLDFIMQDVQNFSAQTDPAKQAQAQNQLQNDMQQVDIYIQNQMNDWKPFALQSNTNVTPLMTGAAGNQNSYVYTVTTLEGATTNYTIPNFTTIMQPASLLQAQAAFQAGQAATVVGNFAAGAQSYAQAAELFYNASTSMKDAAAIANAQNQYYLSQTRMQASGVAALVQPCLAQTVGNFKNFPTAYMVSSAQINIDPFIVGNLPASLSASENAPLSAQQFADFLKVLQIYIVYTQLQAKGYSPATYYQPASLQRVSGLSDSQISILALHEQDAQIYAQQLQTAFTTGFQSGSQTLKLSASLQVQQSGAAILSCTNLPIPLLIPITPNGYTAGAYYIGAYQLFQPGGSLLNFGAQVYVPGQDVITAGLLLQNIMQLYIGCAYNYGQLATNIYNEFSSQLSSTQDVTTLNDQINAMNIAYQNGIAYIQSNSNSENTAYGYALSLAALQDSYASYPANVNQYVVSLYAQWATQLQACLVGNPTTSGYQNVLSTLNAVYMEQANVMPTMANQSNQNIAAAFKKAGDACMSFPIEDSVNGRVSLYPYDTATGYYSAALQQYTTLQDTANQNAMNQQLNLVSISLLEQYAKLYYDIKTNGTMYLDIHGKPQKVTWNQLGTDYLTYANSGTNLGSSQVMDSGELAEYNRVKNLLLNAAINCSYVQNALASSATSSSSTSSGSSAAQSPDTITIIKALVSFNAAFSNLGTTGMDFTNETVRTNLLEYAAGGYTLFEQTPSVLLSFVSQLSSAIAYQYMYDYLGGLPNSTASNYASALQTEWSQFFTALQNEAQSLQNPSSSYLG